LTTSEETQINGNPKNMSSRNECAKKCENHKTIPGSYRHVTSGEIIKGKVIMK